MWSNFSLPFLTFLSYFKSEKKKQVKIYKHLDSTLLPFTIIIFCINKFPIDSLVITQWSLKLIGIYFSKIFIHLQNICFLVKNHSKRSWSANNSIDQLWWKNYVKSWKVTNTLRISCVHFQLLGHNIYSVIEGKEFHTLM